MAGSAVHLDNGVGGGFTHSLVQVSERHWSYAAGASPQPACEGGAFLDFIDPGETCGRSGTGQHSASRSALSIVQAGRRCSV